MRRRAYVKVEFPIGTDVPETTFTVANLVWSSSDPDGDDNIEKFEYVLDDTDLLILEPLSSELVVLAVRLISACPAMSTALSPTEIVYQFVTVINTTAQVAIPAL